MTNEQLAAFTEINELRNENEVLRRILLNQFNQTPDNINFIKNIKSDQDISMAIGLIMADDLADEHYHISLANED